MYRVNDVIETYKGSVGIIQQVTPNGRFLVEFWREDRVKIIFEANIKRKLETIREDYNGSPMFSIKED